MPNQDLPFLWIDSARLFRYKFLGGTALVCGTTLQDNKPAHDEKDAAKILKK
jgi:hypothetical protein